MKIFLLLLATSSLFATEEVKFSTSSQAECPAPWFTGPLLSPSSHIVPKGYFNFEPYLFYDVTTGRYDDDWKGISEPNFNRVLLSPSFHLGITEWMEFFIAPGVSWQESQGASAFNFEDLRTHLSFQVFQDTKNNSIPSMQVYIQEIFPTGKFNKGSADKFGTDIGGKGSYQTVVGVVVGSIYELWNCHFLSLRFNVLANFPTKVNIKGISIYGGAPDTDARVKVGQHYTSLFGLEYSFTQNWVFAFDAQAFYQRSTPFKGFAGTRPDGSRARLGRGAGFQFSIAPAMEYNFSAALGLIGGVWFSVGGKNQPRFINGIIALNYFGPISKGAAHKYRTSGGAGSGGAAGGR